MTFSFEEGKYIVFEGADGSGKTTLATMLTTALRETGRSVQHIVFPGRAGIGGFIRDRVFTGEVHVSREAMFWLFLAEGWDREPQIRQHLDSGDWVICDRHVVLSSRIYQSEVYTQSQIENVLSVANFKVPDRVYLIDVPAKIALERQDMRGEARNQLYESEQIEKVDARRQAYRALRDRFLTSEIVDGTKPLGENLRWIWHDLGLEGSPPS